MTTKILEVIFFIILSVMIFVLGKDNGLLAFWAWVVAIILAVVSFHEGTNNGKENK